MDAYIYDADIYCDDCGRAIRERIDSEGQAPADPDDESTYDSGDYPKGLFGDGGGEADYPQHCGSGPDCINALSWSDGTKAGAFLENPLTSHGEQYVQELHRDRPTEVTAMWMAHYDLEPMPDPSTPSRVRTATDEGQPEWEYVANLGDSHPITYGGLLVFRDNRGVYSPEMDVLEPADDSLEIRDPAARWTVHTVILERCTYVNGILSDNPYHPDSPAWFASPESRRAARPQDTTYLSNVATSIEMDENELIDALCSDEPEKLAMGYEAVGRHFGFHEFDQEPLTLTLAEVRARYPFLTR